jgi:hypothetical protein
MQSGDITIKYQGSHGDRSGAAPRPSGAPVPYLEELRNDRPDEPRNIYEYKTGRLVFYIVNKAVFAPDGKPAFTIIDNYLVPADGSRPSLYFQFHYLTPDREVRVTAGLDVMRQAWRKQYRRRGR